MNNTFKNKIIYILIVFGLFLFIPNVVEANTENRFPRTANYFLHWTFSEETARELSKWDLLVLDMETQVTNPNLLRKIKEWNPDIKMLVYITPQEIRRDAHLGGSIMRARLSRQIPNDWYLYNSKGARLSWWPGTWVLNVTHQAPRINGQRFNQVISKFVVDELLSTGFWDGVFYDNAWDNISWFTGPDVDLNLDRAPDTNHDSAWRTGMKFIYNETRRLAKPGTIIVGNSDSLAYRDDLNGTMLENFRPEVWTRFMQTYALQNSGSLLPRINIINANTSNGRTGGQTSYQTMRFGLTSSLLLDAYYSFDFGDSNHGQLWRYDEYDVDLGLPNGSARSKSNLTQFSPDVWHRSFDRGLGVVNSTDQFQAVEFDIDYEKILGTQDPIINDGSIVSEITLPPQDGLVLLKTLETLDDVVFPNGSFVRFSSGEGNRVRNGFFVFDEERPGGAKIARIDLDGNGMRDLLVVTNNRIQAWRYDGQPLLNRYPYSVNYKGKINVAVGDLNSDKRMEIMVAPGPGFPAPVKIYSRHGNQLRSDWYPLGTNYRGGYSLAIGDVDKKLSDNEVIIGTGSGVNPDVRIYNRVRDFQHQFATQWLAYEPSFKGGVDVAVGDLNGDGVGEVIVGAGPGKPPVVKVFNSSGVQLGREFQVYETKTRPGIQVESLDVNFDGKDDIVSFSSGLAL